MIDYPILRNSYLLTVQTGLLMNVGYEEAKRGNDVLHKFCENCVDKSNYSETDKQNMKRDLELVKEALSQEIEHHFRGSQQQSTIFNELN